MEPIARPYGTDIFGSQGLALCNIPDGKKGTGAFIVLKLLLRGEAEFRGTRAFSMMRIFFTISANSSGSMEKAPSGPPSLRRRVRMLFHHFNCQERGTGLATAGPGYDRKDPSDS